MPSEALTEPRYASLIMYVLSLVSGHTTNQSSYVPCHMHGELYVDASHVTLEAAKETEKHYISARLSEKDSNLY